MNPFMTPSAMRQSVEPKPPGVWSAVLRVIAENRRAAGAEAFQMGQTPLARDQARSGNTPGDDWRDLIGARLGDPEPR